MKVALNMCVVISYSYYRTGEDLMSFRLGNGKNGTVI